MPVSKNRKKHKQKARQRGLNRAMRRTAIRKANELRMKEMMEGLKKQMEEQGVNINEEEEE